MRVLVLGAGLMARGATHDYLQNDDVEEIVICDHDPDALDAIAARFPDARVRTERLDATDDAAVRAVMAPAHVAFCAIHYGFNERFTRLAIECGTHLVDLGGNNDVVRAQLRHHDAALNAGVSIVPDCGLAPGMVSLVAAWGLARLPWARDVHIRVGGLPLDPKEPLRYERLFSVEGLINEYVEPPLLVVDGREVTGTPLGDLEDVEFSEPVGMLEAFNTSGGLSTLADSFAGRVRNLDYKTLRYPGHAHAMRWLYELGFMSSEEVAVDGTHIVPRHLLAQQIAARVPQCERDRTVVRVEFRGAEGMQHRIDIIDEYDEATQLTSMMRMTAFPAAIISQMQGAGAVAAGVLPQERVVDPDAFIAELERRGVVLHGIDVPTPAMS